MDYKTALGEKSTVKATIAYSKDEWDDAINKAYLKTRKRYSVPGFRKGKAPKHIVENFYGKGVFYEDAILDLFNSSYDDILEKEKENFTAIGEPGLSVDDMPENGGITLSAVIPVKPDIEIKAYKGLKIKGYKYEVTDEDVDAEVKKIIESRAENKEVSDRPCANGDAVIIDFSGSVDGVKFERGSAENHRLVLGSGSFVPGFEEQVEGMTCGEEKDIEVTFPEDYPDENIRGKKTVFNIKLKKIEEKVYPELTDEFVKANAGCENVADYKAKCRERLESAAERRSESDTEESIMKAICDGAGGEIPDVLIEREIDMIIRNFGVKLKYQGISIDDYLKYTGTTMEQLRGQTRDNAEKMVMASLVTEKIARLENISAQPEDIDKKIEELAKDVDMSPEDYKKGLNEYRKSEIEEKIFTDKLFSFLKENNEIYFEDEKKEKSGASQKPKAKKSTKPKAD